MRKARIIAMIMAIIMAMNGSITAYATNNGIIETSEAIDLVDVVDDVVNDSIAENDEVDEAVEEGEDEALGEMPIVSEDVDAETTDEMQEDTSEDLSGEILIETKAEIAYQATAESDFTWVGDKITKYNGSASAVEIPARATAIGNNAFDGNKTIQSLTFESGSKLTEIGSRAFHQCSGLRSVTFPESLTTIGSEAFRNTNIENVTIGKNITKIEYLAFADIPAIQKIKIEGTGNITTDVNWGPFEKSTVSQVEFADTMTKIPQKILKGVVTSGTLSLTLPSKCRTIEANAFDGIKGDIEVTFPESLTTIGARAFHQCSGLRSVTFPESLTTIGSEAFRNTNIENVTIGKNITKIEYLAFADIPAIQKIKIEGTGNITTDVNWGPYEKSTVGEIELADTMTKIPSKLFKGIKLSGIVSIYIPDSIVSVASDAFSNVDTRNIEVHLTSNANATVANYFKDKGFQIKQSLSIKYVLNGGTQNPANKTYFESGDTITLAEPTRAGYSFEGWYKTSEFTGNPVTSETLTASVTYYAKWKAITYSITYNANAGTMPSTYAKSYDVTKTVALPKPTKTGMIFAGWYESESFEGDPITSISSGTTGNKVYYARWTSFRYTVKFNFGGGINLAKKTSAQSSTQYFDDPKTVAEILASAKTEQPTKTGYAFKGWCTSSKEGSLTKTYKPEDTYGQKITRDNQVVTLYAIWSVIPHDITYNWNSPMPEYAITDVMVTNRSILPITFNEHAGVTLKNPKVPGFTFTGWTLKEGEIISGTNPKVTKINKGEKDTTLFAHWKENIYRITFNYNGGKAVSITDSNKMVNSIKTQSFKYTSQDETKKISSLTNEPTRQYYAFGGWSLKKNGDSIYTQDDVVKAFDKKLNGKADKNNANLTLYAVWVPIKHNVVYDFNSPIEGYSLYEKVENITDLKSDYYEHAGLTLKNPKVLGFTFTGWAEKSEAIDRYTNPRIKKIAKGKAPESGDAIRLYAHWTENKYTITFNYNGGTAADSNGRSISSKKTDPMEYTSEYSLSSLTDEPIKSGRRFVGWTYVKNGNGVVFAKDYAELISGSKFGNKLIKNNANVTLYAKWE